MSNPAGLLAILFICDSFLVTVLLSGTLLSWITKFFTSLFTEEIADDGAWSDKGPSRLGRTISFFETSYLLSQLAKGCGCAYLKVTIVYAYKI